MAKLADPAAARIEIASGLGFRRNLAENVGVSDGVSVLPVQQGSTKLLDPRMLVWRYALTRQLASQPSRLLSQHDGISTFA